MCGAGESDDFDALMLPVIQFIPDDLRRREKRLGFNMSIPFK